MAAFRSVSFGCCGSGPTMRPTPDPNPSPTANHPPRDRRTHASATSPENCGNTRAVLSYRHLVTLKLLILERTINTAETRMFRVHCVASRVARVGRKLRWCQPRSEIKTISSGHVYIHARCT